jgi:hypothetical protein
VRNDEEEEHTCTWSDSRVKHVFWALVCSFLISFAVRAAAVPAGSAVLARLRASVCSSAVPDVAVAANSCQVFGAPALAKAAHSGKGTT